LFHTVEEEEEDKIDSDFDLDSSEGEQEHVEEGKALDKQIEQAEKRVSKNPIEYLFTKKTNMRSIGTKGSYF
jgi:vacuolar protein sorting-associated protein 72